MALFKQKEAEGHDKNIPNMFEVPKGKDKTGNSELNEEVNTLSRKLRLLEDRYSNLQKKSMVGDQNLISYNKRLNNEMKALNSEMLDLRRMIDVVDNKLLIIIKELKVSAKKEDVELLKKYVNLWEPIKFVTRKEVENIINDILYEKNTSPPSEKQ